MATSRAAPGNDFSLTLARGLEVLELFGPETPAATTSEVALRLGISRAAARRFLLTLTTLGYLARTKANFSLTEKVLALGQGGLAHQDRWADAVPHVLELANRLNDAVSISVLDGLDIRFVVRDPKRRIFSSRLVAGDRLPAHCSAAGKVLLASLPTERLEGLLASSPLQARTPRTITEPRALVHALRQVRIQSWAQAEDEMEMGTISVAVPIFDEANAVVGALALASHKMRRSLDELRAQGLPALLDAAERLSPREPASRGAGTPRDPACDNRTFVPFR